MNEFAPKSTERVDAVLRIIDRVLPVDPDVIGVNPSDGSVYTSDGTFIPDLAVGYDPGGCDPEDWSSYRLANGIESPFNTQ
jgi:hypothetical protein